MYPEKQAKADLVEVVYATLDGYVYFYDLEDGKRTRDPINVGMNFKGAGSLDPRGYPLMYVGSGDNRDGKRARMYIISLIDGKILYEQSGKDSATSRAWYAFDSAPLVDAKTDTLIWPGENGVLYTIKLNTAYDQAAGTISVSPENVAKTVYKSKVGTKLGYEASGIVVDGYFYCADNSGLFVCVDLNTMELKWAQDVQDDINATPIFEWGDDGVGYIYCGTSMEYAKGNVFFYKLRADNGEIVWERKFTNITYNELVSGGVMSTPLIGKKGTDLEDLIIIPIARTPSTGSGTIYALSKNTGEIVWSETNKNYHWSSPVAVYTKENKGYILLGDSAGKITMYDSNGKSLASIGLGSNIEASPAVFENRLVVGTRGQGIFGVEIG
jgi:outer membrane protein assembly factor BamB